MRVLYLHQYFVPPGAPGSSRTLEIARRLVQRGHEVDLITTDAFFPAATPVRDRRTIDIQGIRVHVLPVRYSGRMSFRRRLLAFAEFAFRASWTARGVGRPDLVFASSTPLTVAVPARFASWYFGIPYVFEVRDLWPEVPIAIGALRNRGGIVAARTLERWTYAAATKIIALSPGMREGILRAGVEASRVEVIPNACDLEVFGIGGNPAPAMITEIRDTGIRHVIAYCGTLGRINAVHTYLIDLAVEMARIDASIGFLVVGDGWARDRFLERAFSSGVLNRTVFWHPPVPKSEIASILEHASIGLSLFDPVKELWHNSANKFFDILAAGRPVVVNYGGWQAELLNEHGAGLALSSTPSAEAAASLADAVTDPDWCRACAASARRLAESKFSRDRLTSDLMDILEAAVVNWGGSGSSQLGWAGKRRLL